MLLGEETGYMDMTHSHTITIDKDYEIDEVNPDFGLRAAQKVIRDQNDSGQKRLSCGAKVETKNPNMESDFNAFLASISLPTVKNILPSSSKKDLADTNTSVIDKENHLPAFLMQQVQHSITKDNPQQPMGLQRRRSRVTFSEDDDMDVTTSHTAVIENRNNAQPVLSFASGNTGRIASTSAFSHDDDMELTQSQTAAINVKLTGNFSRNNQSALDHKRSHYFSENDDATEMTGMFDVSRREKEHAISMKAETSISKASKISPFNVAGNGEIMDRNTPGHFQSNLSVAQPANSDDMEMTEALDVSVQEKVNTARMKNESLFLLPKVSKTSSYNGGIVNQHKSVHLSKAQSANYDDMEMTQCQTIVLESEQFSRERSLVNSRTSLPHASMSGFVQDKEPTASITEQALIQIHRPSEIPSIRNEEIMAPNKSVNLSLTQPAYSDDMEMTEALEVSVQEKEYTVSTNETIETMSFPFSQISKKSFNVTGNAEIMDENGSCRLPNAQTDNFDDMEMTRCQTVVFEAKQFSGDKQLSNSRKSLPHASLSSSVQDEDMKKEALLQIHRPGNMSSINVFRNEERGNFSIAQNVDSDDMEMTEALEVSVQEREYTASAYPFQQIAKKSSTNVSGNGKCVDQTKSGHILTAQPANFDDMEMTQCQTVVLESKQSGRDKTLNGSRKSLPHALASENGDGMDMTQAITGRIVLNAHSASKPGRGQSILLPAMPTSSKHDQSDCMDLTGEPSAFAGIASPSPDEMELTGCATVNIDSNRTWLAANTTSMRRAPSLANQTITVAEPMEMTEVHMLPVSERKAFTSRRKSGRGVLSFCDPKNIEVDSYQKNFSNPDDMEMTQCQTVVFEADNYKKDKPLGKPRKSLNLALSRPDVDCMEMTQAFTGNIMLKSVISTEKSKTDGKELPIAQSHPKPDSSDCPDVMHQSSTLGVDDEMEFTGCNTISIDTRGTLAGAGAKIKASESALWASTSVSCPGSSGEQNEVSDAAKSGVNHEVYISKHIPFTSKSVLDDAELNCTNMTKSYAAADLQVDGNSKIAHPRNAVTAGSDKDMQVTKVVTMSIETQDNITLNQRQAANVETARNEEKVAEGLERSANSVQLELSSTESVSDSFIKEEPQHAKSRRRSLADFQMELQNMSRCFNEEVLKGATAPLPSCSVAEVSHCGKEQREMDVSTEPAANVTPNVKQKNTSFQNVKTTPFSLKKQPFSSRVSFSGVMPKLPKRAMAITPNKAVTLSSHDLQCFPIEKCLDVEQNSNCITVNINDEEFPEMSSEEDLSGSLENFPIRKEEEEAFSAVLIDEELLSNDVFETDMNISQALKRPYLEETSVTAEPNKKAYISDMVGKTFS